MSANPRSSVLQNRRVRVFVSSTFRDMIQDRNELMSHTWPLLRAFCRKRHVELVEVDLRWGISEAQSRRKETLKLCMDEISVCRPFFIGILGERYGWVPEEDSFTPDLVQEQPWISGCFGKSVTEIEIMHGVLNDPDVAPYSFFYFRAPAYAISGGRDFLPDDSKTAERQSALKEGIRFACAARKITVREDYAHPRELAELVLQDLTAAIESIFPLEEIPDSLAMQEQDHEAFAEIRRRTYVVCPAYFDVLDRHAEGSGNPLAVLGESGSGKSALLANWVQHWQQAHSDDFVFQHYTGVTPDSTAPSEIARRLIGEISKWTGSEDDLPSSQQEILRTLPLWMAKARAKAERDRVRCILVIDALNQLEDQNDAWHLGWLPKASLSGPLRLIVSTTAAESVQAIESLEWNRLNIEPLKPEECRTIITYYLAHLGKKLDEHHLDRVTSARASANPLYLRILLDELRVTGVYGRLDERLDDYLSSNNIPMLLRKVLQRYVHDYERDRPQIVGEVLTLISAARRGLSEAEILRLLRPPELPQLPAATWAPLRAALEEAMVDRSGILNFSHDFMRTAVEEEFMLPESLSALRLRLAEEFESQPISSRSCDELPWLLWHTGNRDRLRTCLLDMDRMIEIEKRDMLELMRYWVWLGEERTMGRAYMAQFRAWCRVPRSDHALAHGASHLAYFLNSAGLYAEAEPIMREVLEIVEQRLGLYHKDVAQHLNNLALLLKLRGRLDEALVLMKRALRIAVNSGPAHPNVATALNNLAHLVGDSGHVDAARRMMRRALKIDEAYYGPDHAKIATRLSSLAQYLNASEHAEAEQMMRRALKIDSLRLGSNHPVVAIRLHNLANLLFETGRWDDAEPMMREALRIDEIGFGAVHPSVALRLGNLAQLLQAREEYDEAEILMSRAIEIDQLCLEPGHPDLLADHMALGRLYQAENRLDEAEVVLRNVLEQIQQTGTRNDLRVANCLDQLGQVLFEGDRLEEAADLTGRALEIAEALFGEHPKTAIHLESHSRLLQACGRLPEAEALIRRALTIAESQMPPDPPVLAGRLRNLALFFEDQGRFPEAVSLLRRSHCVLEEYYGPEHPKLAPHLSDLARLLHASSAGNLTEAEHLLRRAWELNERSYPPGDPILVADLKAMARLLRDAGKLSESEELMRRALIIDIERYGKDSWIVTKDLEWLSQL